MADAKVSRLAELRAGFAADKERIAKLKDARRFKPL
jgi:hypothetical protein